MSRKIFPEWKFFLDIYPEIMYHYNPRFFEVGPLAQSVEHLTLTKWSLYMETCKVEDTVC